MESCMFILKQIFKYLCYIYKVMVDNMLKFVFCVFGPWGLYA